MINFHKIFRLYVFSNQINFAMELFSDSITGRSPVLARFLKDLLLREVEPRVLSYVHSEMRAITS